MYNLLIMRDGSRHAVKSKAAFCGLGLFLQNGGATSSRHKYCWEDKEDLWKEGCYKAGLWHFT